MAKDLCFPCLNVETRIKAFNFNGNMCRTVKHTYGIHILRVGIEGRDIFLRCKHTVNLCRMLSFALFHLIRFFYYYLRWESGVCLLLSRKIQFKFEDGKASIYIYIDGNESHLFIRYKIIYSTRVIYPITAPKIQIFLSHKL